MTIGNMIKAKYSLEMHNPSGVVVVLLMVKIQTINQKLLYPIDV